MVSDFLLNQVLVFHERVYADNVASKFWFYRSFSSQHYPKFITNINSENITQIHTQECKTWYFICMVNINFLRSLRHSNCNTIFVVIVSFLNESVYGFNNIGNGRVKTRFQIVGFWRLWKFRVKKHFSSVTFRYIDGWDISATATSHLPSRFSWSGKQFVKELSVLSRKSCADAFETNYIVNDSIVKWLWSTLSDKIYRGKTHLVHAWMCMLEVFWKKLQLFRKPIG